MPRHSRLDAPGTLHHVIVRGIEKRKIVDDDKDRKTFVDRLGELSAETSTRIFAWALMTNHAHILLKSSDYGLSRFMHRFLTGYAVRYNLRHRRHGHLFQNRYKSIVCEEDSYFKQLVRYIHLNPLRARIVPSMRELDKYRWCGHAVILGKQKTSWQDRRYVLDWFGRSEQKAKVAYRNFVADGTGLGHQPELVGGGLIRSMGGWSQVLSMRKSGTKEMSDDRILGSGDFVAQIIRQADEAVEWQFANLISKDQIEQVIVSACTEAGIDVNELKGGSRRAVVSDVRRRLTVQLIEKHGLTPTEVARQLGVTSSAITKTMHRVKGSKYG